MSEETPESRAETKGYLLGISAGWQEAADCVLDGASDAFRAGNDDMANHVRDIARMLRRMSEEKRRKYEEHKNQDKAL